eukprot:5642370-Heterocapsa_arctica.AAC.1
MAAVPKQAKSARGTRPSNLTPRTKLAGLQGDERPKSRATGPGSPAPIGKLGSRPAGSLTRSWSRTRRGCRSPRPTTRTRCGTRPLSLRRRTGP